MGVTPSKAVTSKESGGGRSECLSWGFSGMQGWRPRMEDSHFAFGSLGKFGGGDWADTAAFGVLDGHGGREVAFFCQQRLPSAIAQQERSNPEAALVKAIEGMDKLLGMEEEHAYLRSFTGKTRECHLEGPYRVGCTAIVCLVQPDCIIAANVGDSRAILCRQGLAVPLSEDHKPNLPSERHRIELAGGSVERQQIGELVQYRVNGNLNLSRSIGDLDYKRNPRLSPSEQIISSTPDIVQCARSPSDEFLLLACDGVWDMMSNQDAVDFVSARLQKVREGQPIALITEELLDACFAPDLSKTGGLGGDNMTALLVLLKDPEDYKNMQPFATAKVPQVSLHSVASRLPSSVFCSCQPDAMSRYSL